MSTHPFSDEVLEGLREARAAVQQKQATCQHRWEQTFFGEKDWKPGTYQYTCARCGKTSMITLEMNK